MTTPPADNDKDEGKDDPLLGTLIDRRYRVLSRLGDGGMGIVYKVEHTYLNKFFALKVMRPTRDSIERQRFEQEAQLASKIRHKNIVEISDFGVLPTAQPYFVMEFLRGHTLGDAIYEGCIDPLLACHIAAQIASGLQAVHKQNVVHRDLKPDNIFLVDPDEQEEGASASPAGESRSELNFVKIMDFGIAKAVDKNLTGTGMTLGTPEYMSPEQATGDKIDWRSDQYSLGCMIYEMLTGELPFNGKGAFEIMNKHLSEAPMPLRQRRPDAAASISPALEQLVLTMMKKRPQHRLPSMRAVEQALREAVAALRQTTSSADPLPALEEPKTVLMPQASLAAALAVEPPAVEPDTLRPQVKSSQLSDAATRPLLPALRSPQVGQVGSAVAPYNAPTFLMPPSKERGQTPTPRLIEKLAVRVKGTSQPEVAQTNFFERIPGLRWLLHKLRNLLRLFKKG